MEELNHLIELQAVDTEIAGLEASCARIPRELEELEAELAEFRGRVEEARAARDEKVKARKARESDLQTAQQKRDGLLGKLHAIKTNKEYTAALTEIEGAKANIGKLEDVILSLFDEIEALEKTLKEAEREFAGEEKEVRVRQDEKKEELRALETELAGRREARAKAASGVPAGLLGRYEKIRANKGGAAVVPLDDYVCGGCFRRLPPQVDLEIRRGEEIQYCQFCGRMLHLGAARSTRA